MAMLYPRATGEVTGRTGSGRFFCVATAAFAVSAALTVVWCSSMSGMGGMTMPGGWTMSMAWMRMPGQTWPQAAASFIGMWSVMMVAMMLPSLVPMLCRYRTQIGTDGAARLGLLTAFVAGGYFAVWTALGLVIYPLGMVFCELAMRTPALARTIPLLSGSVVVLTGALQFTGWKQRQLASCRQACLRDRDACHDAGAAWRHGIRLAVRCSRCCGGLMLLLLVLGVMDLRAMVLVTAAISAERLLPSARHVAPGVGVIIVLLGLGMLMPGAVTFRVS